MNFKKLESERLYLTPSYKSKEIVELFAKWLNEPENAAGVGAINMHINLETEEKALDDLLKNEKQFLVIKKDDEKIIGNIALANFNYVNDFCELGILMGEKEYWGNGYGYEAINLILDYGFNAIHMHNIYLSVFSFNTPAIELYKKLGFKEIGRHREAKKFMGKFYDSISFDILDYEFKNSYLQKILKNRFDL